MQDATVEDMSDYGAGMKGVRFQRVCLGTVHTATGTVDPLDCPIIGAIIAGRGAGITVQPDAIADSVIIFYVVFTQRFVCYFKTKPNGDFFPAFFIQNAAFNRSCVMLQFILK